MSSPSAYEQLTLEYVNALRTDPSGEYARLIGVQNNIDFSASYFGVDLSALAAQLGALTAVAPLAWSGALSTSAETHTQLMIDQDEQSHNLSGEPSLGQRVVNAGYANYRSVSENIFAYSDDALHGHAGFVIDWGYDDVDFDSGGNRYSDWKTRGDGIQDPAGHRNSLMKDTFTEIGIGVIQDTSTSTQVGEYVTTQHIGTRWNYVQQMLGVVIDDQDGDGFYDIGEGMGGVTVTLVGGGQTLTTQTWASGGWQIEAPAGTYTVTFSGGGLPGDIVKTATIGGSNVKLDAIASEGINDAPVAAVADLKVAAGAWTRLSDVLTASDEEGDAITLYEIYDNTGAHSWWADGATVDASSGYKTADLSNIWFQGDASGSEQTLYVRLHDGNDWGAWASFVLTTNTLPTMQVEDRSAAAGSWVALSEIATAYDADGDSVLAYELWDSEGDASWYADGFMQNARSGYVTGAGLNDIYVRTDTGRTDSTQTLWVRAKDESGWGDWESFVLTSEGTNAKPVLSVADQSVSLLEWTKLDTVLGSADGDGDTITLYEVWDSEGSDNWYADGGTIDASGGYKTANLGGIWFRGDASFSSQTLWLRANDGIEWGAWESFELTSGSGSNSAPVATVDDISRQRGSYTRLDSILDVSDADGDDIVSYEIWDSTGVDNWWADGFVDASSGHVVSDISQVYIRADFTPSTQMLWVRANDGTEWGAWDSFQFVSL